MTRRSSLGRRRRRRVRLWRVGVLLVAVAVGLAAWRLWPTAARRVEALEEAAPPAWIEQDFIPVGPARSGARLSDYTGVVVHYVGNPGTTARNNRNYFAMEDTEVCSHFVVGLDGEIIQCLPLWERSAASNQRNRDTISIEVCHPDEGGAFNAATYDSLVRLTAWLCEVGNLDTAAVIRHYDVTGKACPLYYVQNPHAWDTFLQAVQARREQPEPAA